MTDFQTKKTANLKELARQVQLLLKDKLEVEAAQISEEVAVKRSSRTRIKTDSCSSGSKSGRHRRTRETVGKEFVEHTFKVDDQVIRIKVPIYNENNITTCTNVMSEEKSFERHNKKEDDNRSLRCALRKNTSRNSAKQQAPVSMTYHHSPRTPQTHLSVPQDMFYPMHRNNGVLLLSSSDSRGRDVLRKNSGENDGAIARNLKVENPPLKDTISNNSSQKENNASILHYEDSPVLQSRNQMAASYVTKVTTPFNLSTPADDTIQTFLGNKDDDINDENSLLAQMIALKNMLGYRKKENPQWRSQSSDEMARLLQEYDDLCDMARLLGGGRSESAHSVRRRRRVRRLRSAKSTGNIMRSSQSTNVTDIAGARHVLMDCMVELLQYKQLVGGSRRSKSKTRSSSGNKSDFPNDSQDSQSMSQADSPRDARSCPMVHASAPRPVVVNLLSLAPQRRTVESGSVCVPSSNSIPNNSEDSDPSGKSLPGRCKCEFPDVRKGRRSSKHDEITGTSQAEKSSTLKDEDKLMTISRIMHDSVKMPPSYPSIRHKFADNIADILDISGVPTMDHSAVISSNRKHSIAFASAASRIIRDNESNNLVQKFKSIPYQPSHQSLPVHSDSQEYRELAFNKQIMEDVAELPKRVQKQEVQINTKPLTEENAVKVYHFLCFKKKKKQESDDGKCKSISSDTSGSGKSIPYVPSPHSLPDTDVRDLPRGYATKDNVPYKPSPNSLPKVCSYNSADFPYEPSNRSLPCPVNKCELRGGIPPCPIDPLKSECRIKSDSGDKKSMQLPSALPSECTLYLRDENKDESRVRIPPPGPIEPRKSECTIKPDCGDQKSIHFFEPTAPKCSAYGGDADIMRPPCESTIKSCSSKNLDSSRGTGSMKSKASSKNICPKVDIPYQPSNMSMPDETEEEKEQCDYVDPCKTYSNLSTEPSNICKRETGQEFPMVTTSIEKVQDEYGGESFLVNVKVLQPSSCCRHCKCVSAEETITSFRRTERTDDCKAAETQGQISKQKSIEECRSKFEERKECHKQYLYSQCQETRESNICNGQRENSKILGNCRTYAVPEITRDVDVRWCQVYTNSPPIHQFEDSKSYNEAFASHTSSAIPSEDVGIALPSGTDTLLEKTNSASVPIDNSQANPEKGICTLLIDCKKLKKILPSIKHDGYGIAISITKPPRRQRRKSVQVCPLSPVPRNHVGGAGDGLLLQHTRCNDTYIENHIGKKISQKVHPACDFYNDRYPSRWFQSFTIMPLHVTDPHKRRNTNTNMMNVNEQRDNNNSQFNDEANSSLDDTQVKRKRNRPNFVSTKRTSIGEREKSRENIESEVKKVHENRSVRIEGDLPYSDEEGKRDSQRRASSIVVVDEARRTTVVPQEFVDELYEKRASRFINPEKQNILEDNRKRTCLQKFHKGVCCPYSTKLDALPQRHRLKSVRGLSQAWTVTNETPRNESVFYLDWTHGILDKERRSTIMPSGRSVTSPNDKERLSTLHEDDVYKDSVGNNVTSSEDRKAKLSIHEKGEAAYSDHSPEEGSTTITDGYRRSSRNSVQRRPQSNLSEVTQAATADLENSERRSRRISRR